MSDPPSAALRRIEAIPLWKRQPENTGYGVPFETSDTALLSVKDGYKSVLLLVLRLSLVLVRLS